MRLFSVLFSVVFLGMPAWADCRSIVLYFDGARVDNEMAINRENTEITLPVSMKEGSFRIKPLDACSIIQVEIESGKSDPQIEREMAKLAERRGVLVDRLKALALREDIFTSAAKSQSGKALRKSKSNPEPLTAVRQGTEYAFAQLEGVYRARRNAESELKTLDGKLETMNRAITERAAMVKLSKKGCRIEVSYLRSDLKWSPVYDFRLTEAGETNVSIRAIIPKVEKGTKVSVVPSVMNEAENESLWPIQEGNSNMVASFIFPVERKILTAKPISSIIFRFKNQSSKKLPAGTAICFSLGEYMGKTFFKGANPGEAIDLAFGTDSPQAKTVPSQ
jgi:hypothetical protein